jgi:hypothetical protein
VLKNLGITTKKGVMSDDDDVVEFQSEVFVVLPTHVVFGGSDPELFTLPQPLIIFHKDLLSEEGNNTHYLHRLYYQISPTTNKQNDQQTSYHHRLGRRRHLERVRRSIPLNCPTTF